MLARGERLLVGEFCIVTIEFQRVILKEDARTKFGGSNPMQPTVIEGEKTCTGIRDAIKAGICSDANKK